MLRLPLRKYLFALTQLCLLLFCEVSALPEQYYGVKIHTERLHGIADGMSYVVKTNDAYYFLKFDGSLLIRKFDGSSLSAVERIEGYEVGGRTRSVLYKMFDDTVRLSLDKNIPYRDDRGQLSEGKLGLLSFHHYSTVEYASEFAVDVEDVDEGKIASVAIFDSTRGYNRLRRLWLSADGKYLDATYIFQDGNLLRLRGPNQEPWVINIEQLSKFDQLYVSFLKKYPDYDIRTKSFMEIPRIPTDER